MALFHSKVAANRAALQGRIYRVLVTNRRQHKRGCAAISSSLALIPIICHPTKMLSFASFFPFNRPFPSCTLLPLATSSPFPMSLYAQPEHYPTLANSLLIIYHNLPMLYPPVFKHPPLIHLHPYCQSITIPQFPGFLSLFSFLSSSPFSRQFIYWCSPGLNTVHLISTEQNQTKNWRIIRKPIENRKVGHLSLNKRKAESSY